MKKGKIPYKLLDGTLIPGVTTVLGGVLAKPALIPWAWKLGKDGIDYREHLDEKANIGTLVHLMIFKHLEGKSLLGEKGHPTEVWMCLEKFLEWKDKYKIQAIALEKPMVSEIYKFGGTPDFYGEIDGVRTLIDFKTNPNVYDEMKIQLSAYYMLLKEYKLPIEHALVVNIPIKGKVRETAITIPTLEVGFSIFKHCLEIYNLRRKLK